jgi:hypothetical protein
VDRYLTTPVPDSHRGLLLLLLLLLLRLLVFVAAPRDPFAAAVRGLGQARSHGASHKERDAAALVRIESVSQATAGDMHLSAIPSPPPSVHAAMTSLANIDPATHHVRLHDDASAVEKKRLFNCLLRTDWTA